MKSVADLLALAGRVEQASGPDRELDADIGEARGWTPQEGLPRTDVRWFWHAPDGGFEPLPLFTAEIDAAKTLLHPATLWCAGSMEDGPFARIVPAIEGGIFGPEITVEAATPALALTAAALRARAA